MIRGATLLSLVVGALMAVFVFAIKYKVQDLEAEYTRLDRSIERERQSIHVLTAEWSHLNEPARLRALARNQLGLVPITGGQVTSIEDLPLRNSPPGSGDNSRDDYGSAMAVKTQPDLKIALPPPSPTIVADESDQQFRKIQAVLRELKARGTAQ